MSEFTLTQEGLVQEISKAAIQMFGYADHELAGQHVSKLIPKLENVPLVWNGELNSRLAYVIRCSVPFMARHKNGRSFACVLFLNRLYDEKAGLRLIVREVKEKPLHLVDCQPLLQMKQ